MKTSEIDHKNIPLRKVGPPRETHVIVNKLISRGITEDELKELMNDSKGG